jgi:hypothetical protein
LNFPTILSPLPRTATTERQCARPVHFAFFILTRTHQKTDGGSLLDSLCVAECSARCSGSAKKSIEKTRDPARCHPRFTSGIPNVSAKERSPRYPSRGLLSEDSRPSPVRACTPCLFASASQHLHAFYDSLRKRCYPSPMTHTYQRTWTQTQWIRDH